ncbi:hypothetical protein WJX73_006775 [Symbiochloris irregularis]|uniref:Uncharacterized protein n=1 Tax=Symbiochloris irregularis TaxID=706552 RepID=A0AAW1P0N9_9CHLO
MTVTVCTTAAATRQSPPGTQSVRFKVPQLQSRDINLASSKLTESEKRLVAWAKGLMTSATRGTLTSADEQPAGREANTGADDAPTTTAAGASG